MRAFDEPQFPGVNTQSSPHQDQRCPVGASVFGRFANPNHERIGSFPHQSVLLGVRLNS